MRRDRTTHSDVVGNLRVNRTFAFTRLVDGWYKLAPAHYGDLQDASKCDVSAFRAHAADTEGWCIQRWHGVETLAPAGASARAAVLASLGIADTTAAVPQPQAPAVPTQARAPKLSAADEASLLTLLDNPSTPLTSDLVALARKLGYESVLPFAPRLDAADAVERGLFAPSHADSALRGDHTGLFLQLQVSPSSRNDFGIGIWLYL